MEIVKIAVATNARMIGDPAKEDPWSRVLLFKVGEAVGLVCMVSGAIETFEHGGVMFSQVEHNVSQEIEQL
jgi:hypothetical protein